MITRISQHVVSIVLSSLMLVSVSSQGATPDIRDYPNAEAKSIVQAEKHNYPVVTSPLKKVNGQITADKEMWLDGQLNRRWLQVPAGHDSFAAFGFYEKQLYQQDIKVLFQCDRYTCGESTYWSNNIFGLAGLNGYDRSQSLLVAESGSGSQRMIYTLYTVQRGNRRVQVLFDIFRPDTDTVATVDFSSLDYVLAALDNNGFYDIEGWPEMTQSFDKSQSFKLLADIIKARPLQHWILVVQSPARFSKDYRLDRQLEKERIWGDSIEWSLTQAGTATNKIQVLLTGPAITIEKGGDVPAIRIIAVD